MAVLDKDSIAAAYEDVRNDHSDTMWSTFAYEGKELVHDASGSDFETFRTKFTPEDRGFAYLRVITGDEMSKRVKFVLISWCGSEVGGLKRAKLGTDKATLKQVVKNFAIEMLLSEPSELDYESIATEARKAGGANYGTGQR
ncbi:coactosin-like protein [Watersipora subatra]|uniref:coactosin-like protein n=1 Tax=Watersipora subatra TaxID=2589382 RepID=UPI00355B6767